MGAVHHAPQQTLAAATGPLLSVPTQHGPHTQPSITPPTFTPLLPVAHHRNPLPYFQQYPDADILTSSDHLTNTVPGYELEIWPNAGSAANIGEGAQGGVRGGCR